MNRLHVQRTLFLPPLIKPPSLFGKLLRTKRLQIPLLMLLMILEVQNMLVLRRRRHVDYGGKNVLLKRVKKVVLVVDVYQRIQSESFAFFMYCLIPTDSIPLGLVSLLYYIKTLHDRKLGIVLRAQILFSAPSLLRIRLMTNPKIPLWRQCGL